MLVIAHRGASGLAPENTLAAFSLAIALGADGVEMFRTWRPHFIWMEMRLPVMNGLKAAQCIRALEGGQGVKIVALSASMMPRTSSG